jgi:hypothetical protein
MKRNGLANGRPCSIFEAYIFGLKIIAIHQHCITVERVDIAFARVVIPGNDGFFRILSFQKDICLP